MRPRSMEDGVRKGKEVIYELALLARGIAGDRVYFPVGGDSLVELAVHVVVGDKHFRRSAEIR